MTFFILFSLFYIIQICSNLICFSFPFCVSLWTREIPLLLFCLFSLHHFRHFTARTQPDLLSSCVQRIEKGKDKSVGLKMTWFSCFFFFTFCCYSTFVLFLFAIQQFNLFLCHIARFPQYSFLAYFRHIFLIIRTFSFFGEKHRKKNEFVAFLFFPSCRFLFLFFSLFSGDKRVCVWHNMYGYCLHKYCGLSVSSERMRIENVRDIAFCFCQKSLSE